MTDNTDYKVAHPWIPGWVGERSWTPPGDEPSDFISFDTRNEAQPYKIAHNRDMMFSGSRLEQDYNFIDYFFGDPGEPIRARYYLLDDEVSVAMPTSWEIK